MMTDPQFQPQPYQQPGYAVQSEEGKKHARNATIMGAIGIFIFGIILGPMALVQAKKAEALGVKATTGKVLGWIAIIGWVLLILSRLTTR